MCGESGCFSPFHCLSSLLRFLFDALAYSDRSDTKFQSSSFVQENHEDVSDALETARDSKRLRLDQEYLAAVDQLEGIKQIIACGEVAIQIQEETIIDLEQRVEANRPFRAVYALLCLRQKLADASTTVIKKGKPMQKNGESPLVGAIGHLFTKGDGIITKMIASDSVKDFCDSVIAFRDVANASAHPGGPISRFVFVGDVRKGEGEGKLGRNN